MTGTMLAFNPMTHKSQQKHSQQQSD